MQKRELENTQKTENNVIIWYDTVFDIRGTGKMHIFLKTMKRNRIL